MASRIETYAGAGFTLRGSVTDKSTGAVVDITSAALYGAIAELPGQAPLVGANSVDNPTVIRVSDGPAGEWEWDISPADTSLLEEGGFSLDVWGILPAGEPTPFLEPMSFIVKQGIASANIP